MLPASFNTLAAFVPFCGVETDAAWFVTLLSVLDSLGATKAEALDLLVDDSSEELFVTAAAVGTPSVVGGVGDAADIVVKACSDFAAAVESVGVVVEAAAVVVVAAAVVA